MSGGSLTEPAIARSHEDRLAWTGLLLGGIGLFILNLVFGPVAIGLGVTALRRGAPQRGVSQHWVFRRWAAITAIALGVADLALLAALALHSAAHGGVVWHFGA